MGIQKKILTRQVEAKINDSQTVKAEVGCLALGKPGDIMTRAYGPVVRALALEEDADFGAFVEGKGILVNSNDCAGVSLKFETAKGLKKGEIGSFLVSGAAIVPCSEVEAIAAAMKVQDLIGYAADAAADEVCEIEVNGFDDDVIPSSAE